MKFRNIALLFLSTLSLFAQPQFTITDINAAKLSAYYAPPAAYVPGTQPNDNPFDFDMIEGRNKDLLGIYSVNVPNTDAANRYNFAARTWEMNGKNGALPTPPVYVTLDIGGFHGVWLKLCNLIASCYAGGTDPMCMHPGDVLKQSIITLPPLPAPVIVAAPATPPPSGSPIGQPNGNVFMVGPGDSSALYPNGASYTENGVHYVKTIVETPFALIRYWQKVP